MPDCMIELQQLSKCYKSKVVLKKTDLNIYRGEIFGLIGQNGAGKSTLLKLIGGLIHPTTGSIQIFNTNTADNQYLYERMGLLVENPGLYPNYTAYENLKLMTKVYGIKESKQIIHKLLKLVGLQADNKTKVKHYSMGMRQRLGIAIALIGNPDVLILDEPINGLDPQGIVEIRNLLLELNKEGLTIIISSHILEELSKIATKYGILHEGQLVEVISREDLLTKCEERIEITVDSTKDIIPMLELQLGIHNYKVPNQYTLYVYDKHIELHQINTLLVQHGIHVHGISKQQQSLEQYFLEWTEGAGEYND